MFSEVQSPRVSCVQDPVVGCNSESGQFHLDKLTPPHPSICPIPAFSFMVPPPPSTLQCILMMYRDGELLLLLLLLCVSVSQNHTFVHI